MEEGSGRVGWRVQTYAWACNMGRIANMKKEVQGEWRKVVWGNGFSERSGVRLRSLHSPISLRDSDAGGSHTTHLEKDWSTGLSPNPYSCCHSVLIFHFLAPLPLSPPLLPSYSRGWQAVSASGQVINILGFVGRAGDTTITLLNSATAVRTQPQTIYKGRVVNIIPENLTKQASNG